MQDHPKHAMHKAQMVTLQTVGYMPTPHGRAIAPWREFVEWEPSLQDMEGTWPAKDRLATDLLRDIEWKLT